MRGLGLAISTVGIAACTMLYCLASGHFDLSVGLGAGVFRGHCRDRHSRHRQRVSRGVSAALAMGLLVGLINGIVIAKLRINALITTLATMQIVRGLAYIFPTAKRWAWRGSIFRVR
jgi:L-arabinose transport system permease protein